jgi:hypothetical protein
VNATCVNVVVIVDSQATFGSSMFLCFLKVFFVFMLKSCLRFVVTLIVTVFVIVNKAIDFVI